MFPSAPQNPLNEGCPVGAIIMLPVSYPPRVDFGRSGIYLRQGAFVANSARYTPLLKNTDNRALASLLVSNGTGGSTPARMFKIGSHYVTLTSHQNGSNLLYTTDPYSVTSGWTVKAYTAPMSQGWDSMMFQSRLITCGYDNSTTGGVNYSAVSDITAAFTNVSTGINTGVTGLAANSADTLGVAVTRNQNSAGMVLTSVNGTTWTSQTPTGFTGSATNMFAVGWCTAASLFIYVNPGTVAGTPLIHTCTNGYTMTVRTTPATYKTAAASYNGGASFRIASSATATVIGGMEMVLRTTDGINYTAINLPAPVATATVAADTLVSYIDGAFYAGGPYYGGFYKSSDDGVTWSYAFTAVDTAVTTSKHAALISKPDASTYMVSFYTPTTATLAVASKLQPEVIGFPIQNTVITGDLNGGITSQTAYMRIA